MLEAEESRDESVSFVTWTVTNRTLSVIRAFNEAVSHLQQTFIRNMSASTVTISNTTIRSSNRAFNESKCVTDVVYTAA